MRIFGSVEVTRRTLGFACVAALFCILWWVINVDLTVLSFAMIQKKIATLSLSLKASTLPLIGKARLVVP